MLELFKHSIYFFNFIFLGVEMLNAKVFLKSFQRGRVVVIDPNDFKVGEILEIGENGSFPFP